jgi:hypothetical protein
MQILHIFTTLGYTCISLLDVQARQEPERKRAASDSDRMPMI